MSTALERISLLAELEGSPHIPSAVDKLVTFPSASGPARNAVTADLAEDKSFET